MVDAQPEEILDLGAGDEYGDAVGETEHHRAGNELHRSAESGCAHDEEQDAGHHGAHEQAVNAVFGDDSRDHHDKRAGGTADLHARAAQRGDQEAGDDSAVDAGLRGESRGNRERHGQRQGDEPDGDAGAQVSEEILESVIPQAEDGLGQPLFHRENGQPLWTMFQF